MIMLAFQIDIAKVRSMEAYLIYGDRGVEQELAQIGAVATLAEGVYKVETPLSRNALGRVIRGIRTLSGLQIAEFPMAGDTKSFARTH